VLALDVQQLGVENPVGDELGKVFRQRRLRGDRIEEPAWLVWTVSGER
jgi:hypothetical protein